MTTNTLPASGHMLPANVLEEFGIPVSETVVAMNTGALRRVHARLAFLRREDVLEWIAQR